MSFLGIGRKGDVNILEFLFGFIFTVAGMVQFGVMELSIFAHNVAPHAGMVMVISFFLGYISGESKKIEDFVDIDYLMVGIVFIAVILSEFSSEFMAWVGQNEVFSVVLIAALVVAYHVLAMREV